MKELTKLERAEKYYRRLYDVCKVEYQAAYRESEREGIGGQREELDFYDEYLIFHIMDEILYRKVPISGKREYVSADEFLRDFYNFYDDIKVMKPQGKRLQQFKLFLLSNRIYGEDIWYEARGEKSQDFLLLGQIKRFFKHYIKGQKIDKETEVLYLFLFSLWLKGGKSDDEEIKLINQDLMSYRRKEESMIEPLIWAVNCCAELCIEEQSIYRFNRNGVWLFLEKFQFKKIYVLETLLQALLELWGNTDNTLNSLDNGYLIISLELFMGEVWGKPVIGEWGKEYRDQWGRMIKDASSDIRPLVRQLREYFNEINWSKEVLKDDWFYCEDIEKAFYNRFVAIVFVLLNPPLDNFLSVIEFERLLDYLIQWIADGVEDDILAEENLDMTETERSEYLADILREIQASTIDTKGRLANTKNIVNNSILELNSILEAEGIRENSEEYREIMTLVFLKRFQELSEKE